MTSAPTKFHLFAAALGPLPDDVITTTLSCLDPSVLAGVRIQTPQEVSHEAKSASR